MEKAIAKALIWSKSAKADLQNIYDYYSQFSIISANKLLDLILEKTSILKIPGFEKSGQIDEYNKNYRRLIAGKYKIFYKEFDTVILIVRIFNSSQNPKLIKEI